jgi:hypothetical protein
VGDCLYCVCVRRPDGVHCHPVQDEAEVAVRGEEKKGQLRNHRPHLPCHLPGPLPGLQLALLDRGIPPISHVSSFNISLHFLSSS